MSDFAEYFDRIVCISLDRRADRWDQFAADAKRVGWPFGPVAKFTATDGLLAKPPPWWKQTPGAWGCLKSHERILEDALNDGVDNLLIFEDDAVFGSDFVQRMERFLWAVPEDWDHLFFGGEHMGGDTRPPAQLNDEVLACYGVLRTHAHALSGSYILDAYRHLANYPDHATKANKQKHVDHRFGQLHETDRYNVYAPVEWIVGQAAGTGDIIDDTHPEHYWADFPILTPRKHVECVAVIGNHRSGSSCLAGVLNKLGVWFGDDTGGYEDRNTGGFESRPLMHACEEICKFPKCDKIYGAYRHVLMLKDVIAPHVRKATQRGKFAGIKYPILSAMGGELMAAWPYLKIIHIDRPIEESAASIIGREQNRDPKQLVKHIEWLDNHKRQWLPSVEHITINYHDLLADPRREVERVCLYLGIKPTDKQKEAAAGVVRPGLQHYLSGENEDVKQESDSTGEGLGTEACGCSGMG